MTTVFEDPWLSGLFADAGAARIWSPQQQLKHMLLVEAAFTRTLGSVGSVPVDVGERIARKSRTVRLISMIFGLAQPVMGCRFLPLLRN